MVKKSIQKKKKQSESSSLLQNDVMSAEALKECTKVGHLKTMVTSTIQVVQKEASVTLTFEDKVQIRLEFKARYDAYVFAQHLGRWNNRATVLGVELKFDPSKVKHEQFSVITNFPRLPHWEHFADSREAFACFVTMEGFAADREMKKTMFQLYCVGNEDGVKQYYWLRTNGLEIDLQIDKHTKVFMNDVQEVDSTFDGGFMFA